MSRRRLQTPRRAPTRTILRSGARHTGQPLAELLKIAQAVELLAAIGSTTRHHHRLGLCTCYHTVFHLLCSRPCERREQESLTTRNSFTLVHAIVWFAVRLKTGFSSTVVGVQYKRIGGVKSRQTVIRTEEIAPQDVLAV